MIHQQLCHLHDCWLPTHGGAMPGHCSMLSNVHDKLIGMCQPSFQEQHSDKPFINVQISTVLPDLTHVMETISCCCNMTAVLFMPENRSTFRSESHIQMHQRWTAMQYVNVQTRRLQSVLQGVWQHNDSDGVSRTQSCSLLISTSKLIACLYLAQTPCAQRKISLGG